MRLAHISDLHVLSLRGVRPLEFANKRIVGGLNLLTGRGTLQKGPGPKTSVRTALRAMPVTDFRDDRPIPPVCDVD